MQDNVLHLLPHRWDPSHGRERAQIHEGVDPPNVDDDDGDERSQRGKGKGSSVDRGGGRGVVGDVGGSVDDTALSVQRGLAVLRPVIAPRRWVSNSPREGEGDNGERARLPRRLEEGERRGSVDGVRT